jgi:DNA (cytosine-5)-methyltransferase 1
MQYPGSAFEGAAMRKLRLLDLFSGIGGFSLGFERTGGFETVAFCEIEEFPRKVLAKHWPKVPCYHDIRELTAERLRADGIGVDAIAGGFPCQDISLAGKGAGIEGERSGLWSEYARLIGELRPRFAIMENVSALLGRGLGRVLGDLAALGYDAEWHCIPASAIGAPHRRDRIWIVANAEGERCRETRQHSKRHSERSTIGSEILAHANVKGLSFTLRSQLESIQSATISHEGCEPCRGSPEDWGTWGTEPDVGRVANGVSNRVHRLKALGNAVVPQIPELIGHAILASMQEAA